MNFFPGFSLAAVRGLLCAAVLASGFFINSARAQNVDLSTNNVTVDLSVIGEASTPAAGSPFAAQPSQGSPGGGLLIPGQKNPVSQLHVAVPKEGHRIKLKRPGTKSRKPAQRTARKKTPKAKQPLRKPSPPVIAATKPPAPLTAEKPPAPLTAEKPPAPPAPEKKAEMKPVPEMPKSVAKAAPASPPPATPPVAKKATEPVATKAPPPAPKPAPVVAAKPKPDPPKEQAALPPAIDAMKKGRVLMIAFEETASKLPASAKADLKALAAKLKGKEKLRLQLLAYAGGKSLSASKARRMSLSRALSIRSFLIESGVRSTRIDVRALGSKTTEDPVNRVDVNVTER